MTDSSNCFQNILVATDFSDAAAVAVDCAVKIARRCGAKLTVAHVVSDILASLAVSDIGDGTAWMRSGDDVERLQKELREGAERNLNKLAAEIRGDDLTIETDVLIGVPYDSIAKAVARSGFDLVVVGTRGMSAIKRMFVGSTATRLARVSPVPVWVARRGWPGASQPILIPVDFSPISERLVSLAASLASASGAELHVLHVYDVEDIYGVPLLSEEARAEFDYYRRFARRAALGKLEQWLEPMGMDAKTAALHVARGTPYRVIDATARKLDAGLIVIGSVGRRGLSALLIGNTAEKVLHTLDRSLLVVKPADFAVPQPNAGTIAVKRELPVAGASAVKRRW